MTLNRRNNIILLMFIPSMIFAVWIHYLVDDFDFLVCMCQINTAIMAIIWGITLQRRVIDTRIRNMLLTVVGFVVLLFMLMACRIKLMGNALTAIRYSCYGFYTMIILITYMFFRIALHIGLKENELPPKRKSIFVCTLLMIVFVMTNDIHHFIFSFSGNISDRIHDCAYRPGFIVICAYVVAIYAISLGIVLKKCRVMAIKEMVWLPLILVIVAGIGEALVTIKGSIRINGVDIFQLGEFFFFLGVFGYGEACVTIGLIPANSAYKRLLDASDKPIIIADAEGKISYKSSIAMDAFADTDNVQIFTDDIYGGTVSWAVDMSSIYKLQKQIEEATEQIEIRNEYLHTENDLKEEQSKIDARNNLYDNMAKILNPQIKEIKQLLMDEEDEIFNRNLLRIAVLNAYIKRRSNMELLRDEQQDISLKELFTAVSESCEYIKLQGVETIVGQVIDGRISAEIIILAYEFFEYVVEKYLGEFNSMFVTIAYEKGELKLRILFNAKDAEPDIKWRHEELSRYNGEIIVSREEQDVIVTISLEEGGAL